MVGFGIFGVAVVAMCLLGLGNGTLILDGVTLVMLLVAVPCALLAVAWLDEKLGGKNRGFALAGVLCVALFLAGVATREPVDAPSVNTSDDSAQSNEIDSVVDEDYDYGYDPESAFDDEADPTSDSSLSSGGGARRIPQYEDERWQTTVPELVAVPESERWYNARDHMGTTCTVVGPVVNVYQATDEAGMPVFVDIGEEYPSGGNVTLVIWAQDIDPFLDMLNVVDDGGAWISVTGYLNNYEGMPQFNTSMSGIEFTWWTNVS